MSVIVYTGRESLIIQNKIDMKLKEFGAEPLGISKYDCEEVNVFDAVQDAMTHPMLTDKKVVIIRNPVFLAKRPPAFQHDVGALIDFLNYDLEDVLMIIQADNMNIDMNSKVMKALMAKAEVIDTKELSEPEARGWLKRQFQLNGFQISDKAVEVFFDRTTYDLEIARNEIVKLQRYMGDNDFIDVNDVKAIVTRELETQVYALTNAIVSKNQELVLQTYQDLMASGTDAFRLFSLILTSFSDIYMTRVMLDNNLSRKAIENALGYRSQRVYYLVRDANQFRREEIAMRIATLADYDFKIKTGLLDAQSGVELFLFALSK